MKTVLTKENQKQWILENTNTFKHRWSSRGYGNSKILSGYSDNVIAKAGGCGYDRFGAALGNLIEVLFQDELNKIAKNHCKGNTANKRRKTSNKFYGLFYDSEEKRAYLDGGCGTECMKRILNKIGFTWRYLGHDSKTNNGVEFYELTPITKNDYKYGI